MPAPACPDHGSLVRDLALGRLDDQSAVAAEAVRHSCPTCAAWWRSELEAAAAVAVDEAVASVFAAFQPPARSRAARWLPVAAAAALAAGAGVLWYQHAAVPSPASTSPAGALAQESFDSDRDGDGVVGIEDLGFTVKAQDAREAIFADNLDGGELTGWKSHT